MRRSFEKISSTVLRTFKSLLTVDLLSPITFEEKMVRFFLNTYDDYKPGDSVTIDRDEVTAQLHEYTNSISKRLHPTRKNVDGGLYVGVTGVSFMYYYLSKNPFLSDNKSVYLEKSIEYLKPALDTSAGDKTSFLLGDAGTYALATVLFKETGDEKSADMLKAYKSLYTQYLNPKFLKCGGDEFFVGRAGYLAGALWMSRELKTPVFTNEELHKICDVIVDSGREYSMKHKSPCPLMFHYYNTEYLGAAHGMSFILQMLLSVPGYLKFNKTAATEIKETIEYLASLQTVDGNWPCCMEEIGLSDHNYDMHRVNTWGYKRNGSFDGMVNALYSGMAEIGGAPVFYRIDRGQHVQYISEVWMSRHSFIFRHPKYPGGFYTIYTRPLSVVVWYCVMTMLVVTAVTLWAMLVVQNNRGDNEDSSLSLAGLLIWGAICQQGVSINRQSTSTKLVIFTTFVYAVTLYQYYNATIVSSLLLEAPKNIKTLKDLLNSDLKAGSHDIVYDKDFFKRTTDPVAIELYHKKVATATQYNFFTPEEGIALVKKGGFAFHVETTFAFPLIKATFTEREICETNLVQLYPLQRMGVVVRKNSPFKEHIAYAIRKMYEVGLPPRIQSEIDEPMPECAHTPDSSVFCVGIREFSTPLLALSLGMITSVVVLMCELVVERFVKSSVRQFRN